MRWQWKQGLALAVGLVLVGRGLLGPPDARAEGATLLPAEAGAPIASAGPAAPPPTAQLERPEPLTSPAPRLDAKVQPSAFCADAADNGPIFRAQAPIAAARQMPMGPTLNDPGTATTPFAWRQAPMPTPVTPGQSGATDGATTAVPAPTPVPAPGVAVPAPGVAVPVPGGPVAVPYGPAGPPGWPGVVGPGNGCGAPGCGGMPCPPCGCGPCCADCCCDPCCDCGCCNCCPPGNRLFASAEYLLWWVRGNPVPPLATTGTLSATIPGALGQPGTRVLFGGHDIDTGAHSGVRATVGYWLNDDHTLGVEISGFFLGSQNPGFSITSLGSPFVARPFVDAATGMQTIELVAAPGILGGTLAITTTSAFNGGEANLRSNLWCGCNGYIDGLLGFHYLGLTESLSVKENLTVLMGSGGGFQIVDRFATQNRFYGTQAGFTGEYRFGDGWSISGRATIAMGPTEQIVDITGSSRIIGGSTPGSFPGGLLTQTTNIGRHVRDVFGVVPEVGLNLGYQLNNHIRLFVGYNFLYWNSVIRPGNAIDPRVNTNLLAPPNGAGGPSLPAFAFRGSEFWAQGVTFGIEFRY